MKQVFYSLVALLLSVGCTQTDNYKITGTWAEGNGKTVYLYQIKEDGQMVAADSAVVKNGTFEMSGPYTPFERRLLVVETSKDYILLDGQPIQVDVTKQTDPMARAMAGSEYDVKISGSIEQTVFKQWKMGAQMAYKVAPYYNNKDEKELADWEKPLRDRYNKQVEDFLKISENSKAFAYIITDNLATSAEEGERLYNELTPEVQASYPGQLLLKRIESLRLLSAGKIAPDIAYPAPDGTIIKLSSLRGKYVLVDFWASWCGPCLAEAPNVKGIYEDYKDKGFEVYGVSLDTDKAAWENAIKQNGLDWIHVSSLKSNDPVIKQFNVIGIPCTYLLDREGRIIAKDLRGQALRDKVASLFE